MKTLCLSIGYIIMALFKPKPLTSGEIKVAELRQKGAFKQFER
jgi:hypothetical protein